MDVLLLIQSGLVFKVIPLKKKQILEFSITWHGDTLRYGVSKIALKTGGHRAHFCATLL